MINISYIKLKDKVIDSYDKTLKGWINRDILWCDMYKPMSNSKIQYSPYSWRNGCKTGVNFDRSKQNIICLDVDDGFTIQQFQKMFKKYDYILATTKSHQKMKHGTVCDRFRAVIKTINIPSDDLVCFRTLELLAPFNDVQTLTKTASFLGNDDAIIIENNGKQLDLHKISLIAEQQIKQEQAEKEAKKINRDLLANTYGNSLEMVKEQIDREVVIDILESIGIEVIGNKCRLREDERTMSTKIYGSGYLKDYGSDELSGDIFHVLMELEGMSFSDALRYVRNYI